MALSVVDLATHIHTHKHTQTLTKQQTAKDGLVILEEVREVLPHGKEAEDVEEDGEKAVEKGERESWEDEERDGAEERGGGERRGRGGGRGVGAI